jgi:integrase/recombinase XerD
MESTKKEMNKEEFLKRLETEIKISKMSHYTLRNYINFNQELFLHSGKEPDIIEQQDVKNFLADKMLDKASVSVIVCLAALRFAYTNILGKDPTLGVKRPKRENKIPVVLSKEEVLKLFDSAENFKSNLMLQLLYSSGLRVSELVSLKPNNLDLDKNMGWVRAGKGKKDRMFFISEKLSKKLKKFVDKNSDWNYLFSKNTALTTRNIQKIVQLATQKAGLNKEVHPHTLRHSFATHLLENGVDIRKIQILLGHAAINTTMLYTHISTSELEKISNPLDNL